MSVPDYITLDELKSWRSKLNESVLVKAAQRDSEKNTFLSHSSKDLELVAGAVLVLQEHGANVYVDVGDKRLPDPPSLTTAQVLRDTIRELRKFVLLVSPNSRSSNWIPWELGLADGQKGLPAVALFPAVQYTYETKWTTSEYLALYPRVVWGKMKDRQDPLWMVYDHHAHTATPLRDWLR